MAEFEGSTGVPTSVRFPLADRPILTEIARLRGFSGLSDMIRHATYRFAEDELKPDPEDADDDRPEGIVWSFADADKAEQLGIETKRVGTLLNQIAHALNTTVIALEEGGDPSATLGRTLPDPTDVNQALGRLNNLLVDLTAFIGELKARFPDRRDSRRRGVAGRRQRRAERGQE